MKISIAMATYNGEPFIRGQLQSFVRQTRLPDELVVSDDGSVDSTLDVVDAFAASAPFEVKIHRNRDNLGYSRNFDTAIGHCSGDIIFLSDQDDAWYPSKIERMLSCFDAPGRPLIVICDQDIADMALKLSGDTVLNRLTRFGMGDASFVAGCATAFHASLLPLILPIPVQCSEYDSWIHAVGAALRRRVVLPDALQAFRRHDTTSSTTLINGYQAPSRLRIVSLYATSNRSLCWGKRAKALTELLLRVRGPAAVPLFPSDNERNLCTARLERELRFWRTRCDVVKAGRWRRWRGIARLAWAGQYKFASGWRSVVRDVVGR